MAHYRRNRRSYHHHTGSSSGHLVAFLLIASFGILFAGCKGPSSEDGLEEVRFTADDLARVEELAAADSGETLALSGSSAAVDLRLEGEGGSVEVGNPSEPPPSLDLTMADVYRTLRSGMGATGDNLYRVTNDFLNVRVTPKVTAEAIDRLELGDTVTVKEFLDAAWAKVQLSGGREGYVAQRYIAKLVPEDRLAEEKKAFENTYFVDFGFLNVRKTPNAQSEKIGELPSQAFVKPLSMDEVWARVPFDGGEGYVAVQYLSPFLPAFIVRQDRYTLPILHYRMVEPELMQVLPRHLDLLKKAGVTVITLADFYNLLETQEKRDVRLDPKSVVLAISDVTAETVKDVSDTLHASGVKGTFFLQTKLLGLSGITEKMIMTLLANGNDLQSGGHTGDDLRSLTNAQLDLELSQSRTLLQQYTKKPVFAVGYPRGGINERVEQRTDAAGYLMGVTATPERTFSRGDFLHLPGILMTPSMGDDEVLRVALGGE